MVGTITDGTNMKSLTFFKFSSSARTRGVRALSLSAARAVSITLCGANGGIGQPLSLLIKASPLVTQLSLYDIVNVPGQAADLSHIATPATVKSFQGPEQLKDAVCNAEIVLISAGMPRKPGMTRDDLFCTNASIVYELVTGVASAAPKALIALITNPINSTVPVAAEVLKKAGVFDPKRLFGLTTLDTVRAQTFYAEITGTNPCKAKIPVVGGHAGSTIIPLFSQCCPASTLSPEQICELTVRIQEAGTEVVKAKAGAGSATLSMAYAAALFTNSLCRAIQGEPDVIECAYVQSDVTEATYFANPLLLGPQGVQTNLGYGKVNDYEKDQIQEAIPVLKENIKKGEDFVKNMK